MGTLVLDGVEFREFEEGIYVSETGTVMSLKPLSIGNNGRGYQHFNVSRFGKTNRHYVHRAVAELFIENPRNFPQVDHINGNKAFNWAINLQWISPLDNTRKAYSREVCLVSPDGEKYIFKNVRAFAEEHGLDPSAVSKVLKGKIKHTKGWSLGGI